MNTALACLVLLASLGVLHGAEETDYGQTLSQDTLKELSLEGGRYVEEEMRRALMGVKQMKEIMERNEEKHDHLMKTLKHSSEKKKGAAQLAKEVEQKLGEAEQHCQESLKSSWEECRPCLEEVCKAFYTSTCRRGFSAFTYKVEQFFQKMTSLANQEVLLVNGSAEDLDVEVLQVEDSFGRLLRRVGSLYDRSVALATSMHQEFAQVFRAVFSPETSGGSVEHLAQARGEPDSSDFFQGVGLDEVLETFFNFSRSVLQEFSSAVTQVFDDIHQTFQETAVQNDKKAFPRWVPSRSRQLCADLRRQTSECWQLSSRCVPCQGKLLEECPSVRDLQVELSEVSQLLQVASQQYEEVLQIVKHHTEDTVSWLSNMASSFGWVAELALNSTGEPENFFSISTVVPQPEAGDDSTVEVNILSSPLLTLSVPAELQVDDPAFIQYVAQEALGRYKLLLRHDED
ncbi:clusterin-like protein 1 [Anguilla anguilla]|uniref:clusterin-like protein 1 n=1 Tax=Anguilla anguilla TaxID=7936 RepID=UPI0015B11FFE|nr:clusterin-like protein 1 [Anguilla anguilla]